MSLKKKKRRTPIGQNPLVTRPDNNQSNRFIPFSPFDSRCELISSDSDSSDYEYETGIKSRRRRMVKCKSFRLQDGDSAIIQSIHKEDHQNSIASSSIDIPVLPSVIIYQILRLAIEDHKGLLILCRASRVCRLWNSVAQNGELWSSLDLSFMSTYRRATTATLNKLIDLKGGWIDNLNLTGWCTLNDETIKNVLDKCPNLTSITLSKCQMEDKRNITALTTSMLAEKESYRKLDLSWIQTDATSNISIRKFLHSNNRSLQHLNLAGCKMIKSVIFTDIKLCNQLKILDLSNTSIDRLNIKELQISCPLIEELFLTNLLLHCNTKESNTPNKACFRHLTILSLGCTVKSAWSITDNALIKLTHGATRLRILDVRGLASLTYTSFETLEAMNLERLYLSHVQLSRKSLFSILSKWNLSLVELDLGWTVFNDDSVSKRCVDVFQKFKLPCLESIHLQGTSITDEEVRCIVLWSTKLSYLNLSSCRSISRGRKRCHESFEIELLREEFMKP